MCLMALTVKDQGRSNRRDLASSRLLFFHFIRFLFSAASLSDNHGGHCLFMCVGKMQKWRGVRGCVSLECVGRLFWVGQVLFGIPHFRVLEVHNMRRFSHVVDTGPCAHRCTDYRTG